MDIHRSRAGVFNNISKRLLSDAQEVFFNDFRQRAHPALDFEVNVDAGTAGDLPGSLQQGAGKVKLFLHQTPQIPHRLAYLHLASEHQIASQFKVAKCVSRILRVQLGSDVQLQGNARKCLFDGVVKLLGQAGSFTQNGLELKLRFLARRNLKLQLLRPCSDSFLKLIIGLLQLYLGLVPLTDQDVQSQILPRDHDRPAHKHNQYRTNNCKTDQETLRRKPAWFLNDPEILRTLHQNSKGS